MLDAAPRERRPVLERALALNPNDVMALNSLHVELDQTGAPYTETLRVIERAYAIDPLALTVLDNLTGTLYAAGHKERALAMADELARLMPGGGYPEGSYGDMAYGAGRIDEAIRWYSRSAMKITLDEWGHWRLGRCYEWLGDTAAATRVYERFLSQQPTSMRVTAALVRLRGWSGDPEAALALLRDNLQRYPGDPELRRAQAFYQYLYQTEATQALASLRAASPLLFSDPPELVAPKWYNDAPIAVFLSRQSGDIARASTIAAAIHVCADHRGPGDQFGANWMRVRTAAALGDRIGVAKYLDALYSHGTALPAPILREPLFKSYLNDPQIAPRLAKHAERRAEWRRQLAAEGL
jgi:tetratricopeptide (TPR) repeat protein